eukprot:13227384-Alexandrium_andersonii.AAC.1
MQANRTYNLEHAQKGRVVERPPNPPGVNLPRPEELFPPPQRPEPAPKRQASLPRAPRRAASVDSCLESDWRGPLYAAWHNLRSAAAARKDGQSRSGG